MRIMTNHPVMRLVAPSPWLGQGPITRASPRTYGRGGHGYNPLSLGSFSDWWAVPCNKTMVLAGVAAAAGSALLTAYVRQQEKKKRGARA